MHNQRTVSFRHVLLVLLLGTSLYLADTVTAENATSSRYNIVFIAVDDLASTLGCCGDAMANTPHIDALARRGVLFRHAYCQLPLCNPSRASLLTGLRPDHIKVYDLDRHFREEKPDVITLPQLFKNHGWYSARVGKIYHYNVPAGIGTNGLDDPESWDEVVNPKGRDVAEESLIFNAEPHRKISASLSWLAADGPDVDQTDGMIASEAIHLIRKLQHRHFFLGVGFFRPHTPYVAPKQYFSKHALDSVSLPFAPSNDREDIPIPAFAHNNPVPHYGLSLQTCLRAKQAYYASVSFVDAQVGRIVQALKTYHLTDKTIVVLWSDHGYHLGEHHGIWQKRTLFEESTRSPLVIYAPDAEGNGTFCNRIVEFVDIYPTLAKLCQLDIPPSQDVAGRSLTPLLSNPNLPVATWNGSALSQVLRPADDRLGEPVMGRSVRTHQWRYTEWNEGQAGRELYNCLEDPNEFHNLAAKPTAGVTRIMEQLHHHFKTKARGRPPTSPVNPSRL
ncbi:MAG: sulfatase [Pirellulales bacterium]